MFGLSTEGYALYKLFINLDNFVEGYISFNSNFANNSIHVPSMSIKDILLYLKVINYISIFAMISLMLQVLLKFHYNKNINNIYI
jgi:hypothetical protein